jgi:hypothetical protein
VRAVNSCPFDENAILIPAKIMRDRMIAAGYAAARIRYRIFFLRVAGPAASRTTDDLAPARRTILRMRR